MTIEVVVRDTGIAITEHFNCVIVHLSGMEPGPTQETHVEVARDFVLTPERAQFLATEIQKALEAIRTRTLPGRH